VLKRRWLSGLLRSGLVRRKCCPVFRLWVFSKGNLSWKIICCSFIYASEITQLSRQDNHQSNSQTLKLTMKTSGLKCSWIKREKIAGIGRKHVIWC